MQQVAVNLIQKHKYRNMILTAAFLKRFPCKQCDIILQCEIINLILFPRPQIYFQMYQFINTFIFGDQMQSIGMIFLVLFPRDLYYFWFNLDLFLSLRASFLSWGRGNTQLEFLSYVLS